MCLSAYFRYSVSDTSPGFLFWQYADFSDHNGLIDGPMSEVIRTEKGGRGCLVGPSVQTGLALGKRMIIVVSSDRRATMRFL